MMSKKKPTHIAISTDITSSAVYLQRLEPTTASEYPLTKQEEIILHLYRENEKLKNFTNLVRESYKLINTKDDYQRTLVSLQIKSGELLDY